MNKYLVQEQIGKGGFATVYRCIHIDSGKSYALKTLNKASRGNSLSKIRNEIDVMNRLYAKGVTRFPQLVDFFEDDHNFHIVQQLCNGGTLGDNTPFDEHRVSIIIDNVLKGIQEIHAAGFIHKDIKHDNILFQNENDIRDLKICDFGLSIPCDETEELRYINKIRGTPWFLAPECSFSLVGFKSDIWSVGIMTYMMLSGSFPFIDPSANFTNISQLWDSIRNKEPTFKEQSWNFVSNDAKDFIQLCLIKQPSSRPSAKECLTHSWFASRMEQKI